MSRADVAIIGAGPVGLTLANLLGRRGVSVRIFESRPAPYPLPRAVHFDGEAMRLFQAAGLAGDIAPATMVGRGMLFKNAAGDVLVDWSREQAIGPMGWHESYRFHQPDLEAILADGLARFPHVSLVRGKAVAGAAQRGAGARLALSGGEEVEAAYVVGCDGADSFLRGEMGGGWEDLGFRETWLVADLILRRPRPDLGDYSVQHCDAHAPATYVRGVGDRRRWEMRLDGDAPAGEAALWRRLARWIGPEDAALERMAVYEFRSRIARVWRSGRFLLAGDAAHQMPPFMGQGMCADVRDVGNLAWKLALALKGCDAPLATYETERKENVRQFIDMTVRLGRLINQTAAGAAPSGRMRSIWPGLGPGLGPRDDVCGRLAPQPRVGDGRLADDTAAGLFHILARRAFAADQPVIVGAEDWLAERGLFAVAVRPDGYVFAAARDEVEAGALGAAIAPLQTPPYAV